MKVDLLKLGNEYLVATTPKYALDVSLWFWNKHKLNNHADNDNLKAITRRVKGDFSDALIAVISSRQGCESIKTFDKKAISEGMTLL